MQDGQITTFYSFKGGVGRTMALANVAFIASMNHLKVLVMDWDLEAPGLAYYFRGIPEQDKARAIKEAPGILDLAWSWKNEVTNSENVDAFAKVVERYRSGSIFEDCAKSIVDESRFPDGAVLDIIGAGRSIIDTGEMEPYANALARFSWSEFFETYGGGIFIESLRTWAKANYDIILIDSRTGYADVAGVCTMQLPDTVALTFVYNRQNIEGIASVAKSLDHTRGKGVKLRAVPMRLSGRGTLDEADARSRAIRDLQRSGAFTADEAERDMDTLAVRAAAGVPFYETLAQFAAGSAPNDQLSLDYKGLAEAICRQKLSLHEIPASWRESVRRRLEPKLATASYVSELQTADPGRALEEIDRLIDGALEAELHEGDVDREYIESLVYAAFSLDDAEFDEEGVSSISVARKAVDLVRSKYQSNRIEWRDFLADSMQRFSDIFAYSVDPDQAIDQLLELDEIMSEGEQDVDTILRRSGYKRAIAALFRSFQPKRMMSAVMDSEELLSSIPRGVVTTELRTAWADTFLQKSIAARSSKDLGLARDSAVQGLRWADGQPDESRVLGRLSVELHIALSELESDVEVAADHAISAVRDENYASIVYRNISSLVDVISRSASAPERFLTFVNILSPSKRGRNVNPPTFFFSRSILLASNFARSTARIAVELVNVRDQRDASRAIELLVTTNASVLLGLKRRMAQLGLGPGGSKRQGVELFTAIGVLMQMATIRDVSAQAMNALAVAASEIEVITRAQKE